MNEPSYPFHQISENKLRYEFESIGVRGRIKKVIEYQPNSVQTHVYNLALVDVDDEGNASDLTVSDNGDMVKILATVLQTLLIFFRLHPQALVTFRGSTPGRTRLYRIAIAKSLPEINHLLDVWGAREQGIEPFHPNGAYEFFVVTLKNRL